MAATITSVRSPLKKKPANLGRAPTAAAGPDPCGNPKKRKAPTPTLQYDVVIEDEKGHQQIQPQSAHKRQQQQQQQPARKKPRKDEAQLRQETLVWRQRYKKAFRTFVFYFDQVGSHKRTELLKSCLRLGATVENFFSNKVTHVVSSRTPAALDKENAGRAAAAGKNATAVAAPAKAKSPSKARSLNRSPKDVAAVAEDDLFTRASELGIKVWSVEKVDRVLAELLESNSPVRAPSANKGPSLPHLLRAEALSGVTTERDPDVERPDYNYFSPKSYYVLVEDASGEHRTIVAKEYEKQRRGEPAEWPILHGGVEGRPAFTSREQAVPPLPKGAVRPTAAAAAAAATTTTTIPPAPKPTFASAVNNALLAPPGAAASAKPACSSGAAGLRRSASLNSFTKSLTLNKRFATVAAADFLKRQSAAAVAVGGGEHQESGAGEEYIAASGNSQPLTSNIASMTSGAPLSAHGQPTQAGVMLDARLAHLNKRQILINQVGLRSGSQKNGGGGSSQLLQVPAPVPGKMTRRMSAEGLSNPYPTRPNEPAKPGYCENCRMRYEDFREHCEHKRHRKFALDGRHWVELDDLLYNVAREVLPAYRDIELDSDEEEEEGSEQSYEEADEDMGPCAFAQEYDFEGYDVDDEGDSVALANAEGRLTKREERFLAKRDADGVGVPAVSNSDSNRYTQVTESSKTTSHLDIDQVDQDQSVIELDNSTTPSKASATEEDGEEDEEDSKMAA